MESRGKAPIKRKGRKERNKGRKEGSGGRKERKRQTEEGMEEGRAEREGRGRMDTPIYL